MGVLVRVARSPCWVPIPRDQIVTHTGERFEKYGCALYTAVALSALLGPERHDRAHRACPTAGRGSDQGDPGAYPNIDTSGITSSHDQGDVVELRYIEHNRRVERQTSFMNPILPSDVDKVLDADAFVCVPITDYEVGQPTLRHIKENNSSAIIVLDAPRPDEHADPQRRTPSDGYGPTGTCGCRTSTSSR